MQQTRILHNVPLIGKESFGLGHISINLAHAQWRLGYDVKLWCLDNPESIKWASLYHGFPNEFITGFKLFGPKNLWYSPQLIRQSKRYDLDDFDIIHQHGIWTGASIGTLIFSQKRKIKTIIAPHGSLNQWALNHSNYKKKIALKLYELDNLKFASCLHATSENEISDFRDFGLKNSIAYIENGIQEKYLYCEGNAYTFREKYSIAPNKRILLFLSRISPKKGLDMLVDAINYIKEDFIDWQLIIAGKDEFNHKKDIESQIKKMNLEDRITIIGTLFDQEKNDAFAAAELFILPSRSEGSPMVVLDSLAAGVPVITTKASTWGDLINYNCGWWSEISTQAISSALREAVKMSTEDLQKMGNHGKVLINSKYTWPHLAKKTIRLYDWLLGRDNKPDFVIH